jgi:hypothetical protein
MTIQEIATSFVVAELTFYNGDTDARTAGYRLRNAGFGFQIVNHEDPDDPDEPGVANVWAPAAAWANSDAFVEVIKRIIIGGNPRAFELDYIGLVPGDTSFNDRWME